MMFKERDIYLKLQINHSLVSWLKYFKDFGVIDTNIEIQNQMITFWHIM